MGDTTSEPINKQGPLTLTAYMLSNPGAAPATTEPTKADPKKPESSGSNQFNLMVGVGWTAHHYLSQRGPSDPYKEWVMQLVAAYTRQFHKENAHGFELQGSAQGQQSLTTKIPSFGFGLQASYVQPLLQNRLQLTGFVQTLVVVPITAPMRPNLQFQPVAGASFMYQPKDWLQVGVQGTMGFTVQKGGPNSLDGGFMANLQVNF